VGQVVRLREAGIEVAVVSSGARAAGRHEMLLHRPGGPEPSRQALASIGQHRLMQTWGTLFDAYDTVIAQVLLTRRDLADRTGWLNARTTLRELLEAGVVPVVNENDAVALDEVLASRIGENDSLSAYVANLVEADLLVLLTDVDGLYDSDPHTNPTARLIPRVERLDDAMPAAAGSSGPGIGGMITKLTAARVASSAGVDVIIASGKEPGTLARAAAGEPCGTVIPAAADRLEARKRWILGNIARGGHIVVDAGAAAALRRQGRSLLPAGILNVEGDFDRGQAVEVKDPDGVAIAAGTANYGSSEVGRIRGLKSAQLAECLGYTYGDEVIHRDNLIVY
jgi:glutamate 5-kinase